MDRRRKDGARVGGRESTGTGRGMVSRRYDKAVALTSRANTPLSVLPGSVCRPTLLSTLVLILDRAVDSPINELRVDEIKKERGVYIYRR